MRLTIPHLLTAACIMTSSMLYVRTATADTTTVDKTVTKTTADADKALALPAGITSKELNSENAIEKSFKGLTEYAVDTTGFDNIVSYLNDQDSIRIKKSTDKSLNNLDGEKNKALRDAIANLEGSWQTKYGKKFSIDYKAVYTSNFLHIATGEVSDPAQLVGHWPVTGVGMMDDGKVSPADAQEAKDKMYGGKVNLEKGRNVAIARIDACPGMPAITASLIHETASGWHFDIPNNIDAQMLYSNLVSNLTALNNDRDHWPADVNDGYRAATHAVVLSLYNIDIQKLPKAMANDH